MNIKSERFFGIRYHAKYEMWIKGTFKLTFITLQKVCVYADVRENYISSVGRQIAKNECLLDLEVSLQ